MAGSSRVRRFQVIECNGLTLESVCPQSGLEDCTRIPVGHTGYFITSERGRKVFVHGEAIFIGVSGSDYSSVDRSSTSWNPVNSVCVKHQKFVVWVKVLLKKNQSNGRLLKCSGLKSRAT